MGIFGQFLREKYVNDLYSMHWLAGPKESKQLETLIIDVLLDTTGTRNIQLYFTVQGTSPIPKKREN